MKIILLDKLSAKMDEQQRPKSRKWNSGVWIMLELEGRKYKYSRDILWKKDNNV